MNPSPQTPEAIYFAPAHPAKKQRNYTRIILIGWFFAFMISLGALSGYSVSAPAASSKSSPAVVTTNAETFYVLKVNELRAEKGLKPVRLLVELNDSSTEKANDMVAHHYWGHYAPDGGLSFSDIIWKHVPPAQIVGENLARCFPDRDSAFAALVASPAHYAIMTGDFNYMGVSESYDPTMTCTITAMHFARI